MIKLATMTSVCPDMSLDEIISAMKKFGYQGLEARVEWKHRAGIEADLSADERKRIRERFAEENLSLCCVATSCKLAVGGPEERARHVEDLHKYIDLAGDLGCPLVRTFGGKRPRDMQLKGVVAYVADAYSSVMARAEERQVTVLMELHDDWSSSIPVREVMKAVAHPRLGVLWDIMHPQRMLETPEDTFCAVGKYARHLHAHDGRYIKDGAGMEATPLGEGDVDHLTPMKLLSHARFAGFFSVEVIHKPGSEHDAEGVLSQYAHAFRNIASRL